MKRGRKHGTKPSEFAMSLPEIARHFGCTPQAIRHTERQAIRHTERRALRKIREALLERRVVTREGRYAS
jgi:hypothetical protein